MGPKKRLGFEWDLRKKMSCTYSHDFEVTCTMNNNDAVVKGIIWKWGWVKERLPYRSNPTSKKLTGSYRRSLAGLSEQNYR